MKLSSLLSPSARDPLCVTGFWLLLTALSHSAHAINFDPVPSPNLDLSQLGRVGLAGDFGGISLYQFEGQTEDKFNTNGSQSVLARLPNGAFTSLAASDAGIQAMCPFVLKSGNMAGIIVAGNFTSLGGMESQGIAMFDPNTTTVTPLPGLSGQVSAIYCDASSSTVYVGGSFRGANSTNAIAWVGTDGWTNLPFLGFNGPVTSVTKSANGHMIFGGSFTGLGNSSAPNDPDKQIVNISGGNITSGSATSTSGFNDPRNIVCKTGGNDGPGNTWLLQDTSPGFWRAEFGFGFYPTKLRLWNTRQGGRGTKTWRYTALPLNGIMNFTYTDPSTGRLASCTSECPLSNDINIPFQDFHFVNNIGMNTFQIDISDWYGSGAGLTGIELFQNDIYAYAIDNFNEPSCANISTPSNSTTTGPWAVTPSRQSVISDYLSATLTDPTLSPGSVSVIFQPDIKQSGNYSVNIYTPGCIQDNTCLTRGRVNITGTMGSGPNSKTFQTEIFQSNNFDKYDQIYFGYIEASSSSFRPTVTISPSSGQNSNLTVVAQRVGFTLLESSGGLNNLFEWDPALATANTADFATSTVDKAGMGLGQGSGVMALATSGSLTFVGGNFTTTVYDNIFGINSTASFPLAGGGLNAPVMSLFFNGTILYVAGNFTGTSKTTTAGLNNVAAYDTSSNSWSPLGAGVNGRVFDIVSLSINVSNNTPETVISFTGNFDKILPFGSNQAAPVSGFAIWVPSRNNWLQNINSTISITGALTASVDLPGGVSFFTGSLSSSQVNANGAVTLSPGLSAFPVRIQPSGSQSSSGLTKRATASQNISGVVTGLFYEVGGRNVTVLGGHFAATATSGSTVNNLLFINGSNSDTVTGLGSQLSAESTVLALTVQGDVLFAGGSLSGTIGTTSVSGLIAYDLRLAALMTQPPALSGGSSTVYSISTRPNTGDVYVAGSFSRAGAVDCPGVCFYTTSTATWTRPGTSLAGVTNALIWASGNTLIAGGSLSVNGVNTSLASYDAQNQVWSAFTGASAIPGPVTALTAANSDISQLWVTGTATNGSAFVMKCDGSTWIPIRSKLGSGTTVRGLQVLTLTQNHGSTDLVPADQTLMLTGSLNLPGFGNASAVLFNGTAFSPFALTSSSGTTAGSLSQIFSQQQNFFSTPASHLALGFVVLIGLAIALGLIFLIVIAGIIAERIRRKREGYVPAPTNMFDKTGQMSRLPPEQIFGTIGHGRGAGAPMI